MSSISVLAGTPAPINLGTSGSTVTNQGESTVYYRDELPVTATVNDGSIAAGASVDLYETQNFFVPAPGRTSLFISALPLSVGSGVTYPDASAATVVPRPRIIDARDYGLMANGSTDDSAALQAALTAAKQTAYSTGLGLSGNDIYGTIVELPFGRIKLLTGVTIPSNVWLRGKGPSGTYLYWHGTTGFALTRAAGGVQATISDLGIVQQGTPTAGGAIALPGAAGASILGDSRDVVRDVVIVSTYDGIVGAGSTEARFDRVTVQRPVRKGIDLNGATDAFISNCTVGQAPDDAFVLSGANSRIWGCKAFGGGASGKKAFNIAGGGRHQLAACEVQDYNGGGFYISSGSNILSSCFVDSVSGACFEITASGADDSSVITGCKAFKRSGGAYTPTEGVKAVNVAGTHIDITSAGITWPVFLQGSTAQEQSYFNINNERGAQSVAYAASITPNPYVGGKVYVGSLTGNITINEPTVSGLATGFRANVFHTGQRIVFYLAQDATGGRTVTFNSIFKLDGGAAVPTTASTVTIIEFEFDKAAWREVSRSTTT